jgi:hypothetical protein
MLSALLFLLNTVPPCLRFSTDSIVAPYQQYKLNRSYQVPSSQNLLIHDHKSNEPLQASSLRKGIYRSLVFQQRTPLDLNIVFIATYQ